MGTLATYAKTQAYNYFKGTAMATAPTPYMALFNGDPEAGGTEVTTTVRVAGRLAVTFASAASRTLTNSVAVNFGAAAGAATVSYWALYDAASAGNLLASGIFTPSNSVAISEEFSVAIGDLDIIAPAGMMSDYFVHKLLNWIAGTSPGTAPATRYAAIYLGDPQGAGVDKSSVQSTGRKTMTVTGSGPVTNSVLVDFGGAVTGGTIDFLGIFDAVSGGNLLISKTVGTQTPGTGEQINVPISNLSFTMA